MENKKILCSRCNLDITILPKMMDLNGDYWCSDCMTSESSRLLHTIPDLKKLSSYIPVTLTEKTKRDLPILINNEVGILRNVKVGYILSDTGIFICKDCPLIDKASVSRCMRGFYVTGMYKMDNPSNYTPREINKLHIIETSTGYINLKEE